MTDATSDRAETTDGDGMTRREQAVARSLDSARHRAEQRVQRFLDAALELMASSSAGEFTVQEVVERSGQSLRSFYQYFGGKHELLLALFDEAIRHTAAELAAELEGSPDAGERLRRFVLSYHRRCQPVSGRTGRSRRAGTLGPSPVLAEFAQQLLTAHPAEAARSFTPLVDLFEGVLDDAAVAGVVRSDLDLRRVAGVVLESIMFDAFSATIAGAAVRDGGDELWELFFAGLAPRTASPGS